MPESWSFPESFPIPQTQLQTVCSVNANCVISQRSQTGEKCEIWFVVSVTKRPD